MKIDTPTVILLVLIAVMGFRLWLGAGERKGISEERDRAATSLLIIEAERDGLQVTLGQVTVDFSGLIASSADTLGALARTIERLEAAGVREASVVEISIVASRDTITVATIDTVIVTGQERLRSSMDDGVLDVNVDCDIQSALCRWQYQLTISGRILQAVGADGRPIAIAEIDQPNVRIDIPTLVWKLPGASSQSLWDRVFSRGCIGLGALAGGFTLAREKTVQSTAIAVGLGCVAGHIAF